jgi:endonuclease/exonuclease/phosphatase family metal-dependent hydrolase
MTYNIRHGRGHDDRVDLGRVADVIAASEPDVVTLQEVDSFRKRSRSLDQPAELARRLGMEPHFTACISEDGEHYGIATLSRLPVTETRRVRLPAHTRRKTEPRYALATRVDWRGTPVEVVNTHLSVLPGERPGQVAHLLADLGEIGHDVVLGGDFNVTPWSPLYRRMLRSLYATRDRGRSWPARLPLLRLDHVLYRGDLDVTHSQVVDSPTARRASDHLPVVASFRPRR